MSNKLSNIKLKEDGIINSFTSKTYDKIIIDNIIININRDILRKLINSFSDNGFSAVSRGLRQNIQTADASEVENKIVLVSYIFETLITTILAKMEKAEIIAHFISVDA